MLNFAPVKKIISRKDPSMRKNNATGELNKEKKEMDVSEGASSFMASEGRGASLEYKPSNEPNGSGEKEQAARSNAGIGVRAVMLLVAALMLVLSFFPFAQMKLDVSGIYISDVKCSNADSIMITGFSFVNLSEEDIEKTKLYESVKDNYSPYQNMIGGSISKDDAYRLTKTVMYLSLMREDSEPTVSTILCSAVSLIYVISCFMLFLVCLRSLLAEMRSRKSGHGNANRLYNKSCVSLWGAFMLLPLVGFCFYKLCGCGFLSSRLFLLRDFGFSPAFFVSLAVSGVLSVVVLVKRIKALKRREKGSLAKSTKSNLKTCIISVLLAVMIFIPGMRFDFSQRVGIEKEYERRDMSISEFLEVSQETTDSYASTSLEMNYWRLSTIRNQVFEGGENEALLLNNYYNTLVMGYGREDVRPVFIAIILVSAALLLSLVWLVKRCLREIFFDLPVSSKQSVLKRLTALLALAEFGLMIAVKVIFEQYLFGNIVKMVQINLSVAPILMFVLAILLLAGSKRTKKYKAIDREYDNPDVSYAPYVVK